MTAPVPVCPSCGGAQLPQPDPRGVLAWTHSQSCPLLVAEDARAVADRDAGLAFGYPGRRATTATERLLLDAAGWSLPHDTDEPTVGPTVVTFPSPATRRRVWPDATPKETPA